LIRTAAKKGRTGKPRGGNETEEMTMFHTAFMERRSCTYLALIRPAESTIRETTVGAGLACRA
jgi:hypothetical protein